MEFSFEKFNQVKKEAEESYRKINSVKCPYFNDIVHFNSKGIEHLIFKRWNNTRPVNDQFSRFRHLSLAPEIIKNSKTIQGIWTTQKFERVRKTDSKWEQKLKLITYYEFIAVMESHGSKVRTKIIVKQVEGGEKYFFSLIPYWGKNKKGERVMHTGDPDTD